MEPTPPPFFFDINRQSLPLYSKKKREISSEREKVKSLEFQGCMVAGTYWKTSMIIQSSKPVKPTNPPLFSLSGVAVTAVDSSSNAFSHEFRSKILIQSTNHLFISPVVEPADSSPSYRRSDLVLVGDMASKTSSRSRGVAPVKSISKETGSKLEENLNIFKSDKFDADAFVNSKCNSMNEKVRDYSSAFAPILGLKICETFSSSPVLEAERASAEEMRRSVYANYTAFIRTSKEISDLEGELLSIRNLLSTQATLIHSLADGVHVESLSVAAPSGSYSNGASADVDRDPSDLESWLIEFPDILDVLLAERRVEEALATLDEGERIASEAKEKDSLAPSILASLQNSITECRQRLANQLADAASQPTTRGGELRAAISALKKLGDGPRAHSLLLQAHTQRLQSNMQNLRPSSTSYGGAYTAAISQLVFSVIAQTATDSNAIFGKEPAYSSELVMWATKQTEDFAILVKRHALASSAAAGGLRAAAECVQIALGHCSLLETRGLALCPVLLKLFRPSVEQALDANLKRIEESTAALAAADDWDLSSSPAVTRLSGRPSSTSLNTLTAYQHKLSSSAQRFNSMIQDFFEDVGPMLTMQLGGKMLEGLFHVFNSYVSMLIRALPASMEEEANYEGSGNKIVRMAETEAQQMALLANASLLADELLPRAAMKLTPVVQAIYKDDPRRRPLDRQNQRNPEQREWKRRLASIVDRLKDSFCRQHALDLIFTEDDGSHLTADMYINMDGSVEEIEWFPSPIFQELYSKLYRMSAIAAEMFAGRERFSTMLLMRLTETVILWLSEEPTFWEDIEEGPTPLGPLGLQQFYLDMKFVISFASQGRYLSRNLNRVVNEIINKALAAFSVTGMDPYSVLPEDEWFGEICQEAIDRLSGKPKLANGERDLSSPTASVSAQSISSIRSHALGHSSTHVAQISIKEACLTLQQG
ncbi:hypothetical protein E3N88_05716 [Mikania micrantha]|uniref:Exocyst component Exo84 C-terminal domain-containing protein n=1 Tax=Mikania micrantha TaxID=192012 RepID=A0A5N6PP18_9ASTR|nr:hypothetical protein E3N88_05716 [Mikania micrantha]